MTKLSKERKSWNKSNGSDLNDYLIQRSHFTNGETEAQKGEMACLEPYGIRICCPCPHIPGPHDYAAEMLNSFTTILICCYLGTEIQSGGEKKENFLIHRYTSLKKNKG